MSENMEIITAGQAEAPTITSMRPLPIAALKERRKAILELMREMMIEGTHYGTIPGTDKMSLLKPGAELACSLFGLSPEYIVDVTEYAGGHREYRIRCRLMSGDRLVAEGLGSCSTMESKYRWRKGTRKCPKCSSESIFKDKEGKGWYCWAKKGGCGATFPMGDLSVEGQKTDRAENPDLPDQYNTCLKMGKKRALSDAAITATGVSDIFSQDMAGELDDRDVAPTPTPTPQPSPAATPQPAQPAQETKQPTKAGPGKSYGPTDYSKFRYRYHLPYQREGFDMDAVRAEFKKAGYRFSSEDKHWYGNQVANGWEEYLRPLATKPKTEEDIPFVPLDGPATSSATDDMDEPPW